MNERQPGSDGHDELSARERLQPRIELAKTRMQNVRLNDTAPTTSPPAAKAQTEAPAPVIGREQNFVPVQRVELPDTPTPVNPPTDTVAEMLDDASDDYGQTFRADERSETRAASSDLEGNKVSINHVAKILGKEAMEMETALDRRLKFLGGSGKYLPPGSLENFTYEEIKKLSLPPVAPPLH